MGVDIVYIIGTGSKWNNNELRFSLRSIAKNGINVGRVIIVGECPKFVNREEVIYIPAKDETEVKHTNIMLKIAKVIDTLHLKRPFLISSDDHFYVQQTDLSRYPHYYKGSLPTEKGKDAYRRSLYQTRRWLNASGFPAFMSNPHCNTWIHPDIFAKLKEPILKSGAPDGIEINCAMGNYYAAMGKSLTIYQDAKKMRPCGYYQWQQYGAAHHCISISDDAIDRNFCRFIFDIFPAKCKYEAKGIKYEELLTPQIARRLRMR